MNVLSNIASTMLLPSIMGLDAVIPDVYCEEGYIKKTTVSLESILDSIRLILMALLATYNDENPSQIHSEIPPCILNLFVILCLSSAISG